MGGKRSINQTHREGKEGVECIRQVKLGKEICLESLEDKDGGNLSGFRGDVQTMPV